MLELHVPQQFTPARPAVRFSHDYHDFSINEHPNAKHLPKTTSTASIQPGVVNFYSLGARSDAPVHLEDLLCSDEPQISLHVVSFTDATVVGLLFSHVLFGASGMQSLVTNWSLVLAGRVADVMPVCGARKDILDDVGVDSDPEKEAFLLDPRRLRGLSRLRFNIRFLWDIYRRPQIESKILCLPASFVGDLRTRAMADLHAMDEKSTANGGGGGIGGIGGTAGIAEEAPFVSEGDVLTAWWTRLVCAARGSKRSVTVFNAVDITGRLKSVFAPGKTYVQNFALGTWTVLSSKEILKAPLGYVARCFRYDIQTQTTPPQIAAFMRRVREGGRCSAQPLFGKPDSLLIVFTNWSRCKFFECIDFAPAVMLPSHAAIDNDDSTTCTATSAAEVIASEKDDHDDGDITSNGHVIVNGKEDKDEQAVAAAAAAAAIITTADAEKKAAAAVATANMLGATSRPPPGKIAYHHSLTRTRGVLSRNVFTILGKDLQGNVWVSALGHPECWEHLEKAIKTGSA